MNNEIVMYASAWCGYCHRARSLLQSKNVEFTEVVIDGNSELRRQMIARTGRQTVPQIFIGERHLGGCDELVALELAGELDALLVGKSITA
ncbi:MAG: glutaredoxin 3 [Gammaproteobacteria bacterium]|jgi:glutaredoxin 3|nr:glutaredoxin 3 [Gammaproteobacteria bacterium]